MKTPGLARMRAGGCYSDRSRRVFARLLEASESSRRSEAPSPGHHGDRGSVGVDVRALVVLQVAVGVTCHHLDETRLTERRGLGSHRHLHGAGALVAEETGHAPSDREDVARRDRAPEDGRAHRDEHTHRNRTAVIEGRDDRHGRRTTRADADVLGHL